MKEDMKFIKSEKYSTEELVKWAKSLCTWEMVSDTLIRDAIIAGLRAADRLCEAANFIAEEIAGFADDDHTEYQVIRFKALVRLRKAIAEYTGGKC